MILYMAVQFHSSLLEKKVEKQRDHKRVKLM